MQLSKGHVRGPHFEFNNIDYELFRNLVYNRNNIGNSVFIYRNLNIDLSNQN